MPKRNKGLLVAILIPIVFGGLVLFQWITSRTDTIEFLPTPVVVGTPGRRDLQEQITFSGNLRPETTALVVPKVSGRIVRILISEGDVVQADQVLAVLDDEVLQLQARQAQAAWEAAESQFQKAIQGARPEEVETARATLSQARQDLENASTNFSRTENLYQAGTISQARYEEAQNAFANAQTQVANAQRSLNLLIEGARTEDIQTVRSQAEAAQRQYDLAELQVSYAQVRAPVTGRISAVLSDEGNLSGPQSPLFAIISEGTIFARIPVPEGLYGRFLLRADEIQAEIRPIAYPNEIPFIGSISRVASTIDPATRTFEVEVGVNNRQDLLRPGMYVNVTFTLNTLEEALVLPSRAVLTRDGQRVVFLFHPDESDPNQGWVRMQPVLTGGETRQFIQITEGLEEGDLVIINGNSFLEDDQRVRRTTTGEQDTLSSGPTDGGNPSDGINTSESIDSTSPGNS